VKISNGSGGSKNKANISRAVWFDPLYPVNGYCYPASIVLYFSTMNTSTIGSNGRKKLSLEEVQARLGEIPGWQLKDGKLHREFKFHDFQEAFAFMTRAALVSEKYDHHPEWSNVYNQVTVDLMTHSAKGISELDFAWASAANKSLKENIAK
jgi:4a-hydroxytetrahydrobiopterin dehydratase